MHFLPWLYYNSICFSVYRFQYRELLNGDVLLGNLPRIKILNVILVTKHAPASTNPALNWIRTPIALILFLEIRNIRPWTLSNCEGAWQRIILRCRKKAWNWFYLENKNMFLLLLYFYKILLWSSRWNTYFVETCKYKIWKVDEFYAFWCLRCFGSFFHICRLIFCHMLTAKILTLCFRKCPYIRLVLWLLNLQFDIWK